MNYRKDFEKCFEFIKSNIKEELKTTDLAEYVGYSVFHFCRIFYIYQEMTPMEYILDRRLQASLIELIHGKKIIDIANEYQFETPSGFSKAFRRKYKMSPIQYRMNYANYHEVSKDNSIMNCPIRIQIKEIESISICGYCFPSDYESTEYNENMVAFWSEYEEKNIEERLYEELNPQKHAEIGIIIKENTLSSKLRYMIGVIAINKHTSLPLVSYKIAGGKYAIITTPPVDMTENEDSFANIIKKIWKYIFIQWFSEIDYEYDETRNDFEYYDERCHYSKDAVMDIYIPIK